MKRTGRSASKPSLAPRARGRSALLIAVAIASVASAAAWFFWPGRTDVVGPIVLISIDTLRADRLPAYGYKGTNTPQIDRLAADGTLFERAYAHSPQTLPSHTSILSGQLPFEHGVRDNIGFSLKDDQISLQHVLHAQGFETGGFVSAYVLRRQTGFGNGFDLYDDNLPAASPDLPLGQVQRPGPDTVAAAIGWIDRQKSQRFFLFVHIYEPHRPYSPPERYAAQNPYDGEVNYSDAIVGVLLDHLRLENLYDRATIILLSDHGEGLGDHGEDEHGILLYRETIQVPLIVKLPGSRGGNRRVHDPVQHIDLMPTILDLAAAPMPGDRRGRSLRPVLEGSGRLSEAAIYSEAMSPRYHFGWSELHALTDARYRFIRAPRDELYDVERDPNETTSVADERPQVRDAMRRMLQQTMSDAVVDAPSAVSEADRQKLAALGYVGTQTGTPLSVAADQLPDPKDKIDVLKKYKRAIDLAGQRQFADAAVAMRELLRSDPQMTDVWVQLANMYERLGRTADAVAAYKEGIKSNPQNAPSLTGAAAGLLQLGRPDEARAHAELAVAVAPAAAHELLARIALERGDAEAARREARLVQAADPSLPAPEMIEGRILHKQGRYAAALQHFMKAREALANRTIKLPDVNYYIADSLARLERYREAEPFFTAELDLFPNNIRARAGQAMLYRATGRFAESEQAIATMLRTSPTPEAYDLAAQLWTMFGEPERAAAAKAEGIRRSR